MAYQEKIRDKQYKMRTTKIKTEEAVKCEHRYLASTGDTNALAGGMAYLGEAFPGWWN